MTVDYNTHCQYIGPDTTVCTCTNKSVYRSYCADHVWLIYQKGTRLGRRNRDIERANDIHLWESLFNEAVEELISEGEEV